MPVQQEDRLLQRRWRIRRAPRSASARTAQEGKGRGSGSGAGHPRDAVPGVEQEVTQGVLLLTLSSSASAAAPAASARCSAALLAATGGGGGGGASCAGDVVRADAEGSDPMATRGASRIGGSAAPAARASFPAASCVTRAHVSAGRAAPEASRLKYRTRAFANVIGSTCARRRDTTRATWLEQAGAHQAAAQRITHLMGLINPSRTSTNGE